MPAPRALPHVRAVGVPFLSLRRMKRPHTARFSNRLNAPEVIARASIALGGNFKRSIECEHPAAAMRCNRNPLSNCLLARRLRSGDRAWCRSIRSAPFHPFAMPHDYSAPIHGTRRSTFAVRKLRAESDVRRICKRCNAARRKPIGKTGSGRTEVDFKPEAGIYSRKQKKQQDDERRRLSEQFASGTYRRPERSG